MLKIWCILNIVSFGVYFVLKLSVLVIHVSNLNRIPFALHKWALRLLEMLWQEYRKQAHILRGDAMECVQNIFLR